MAVNRLADVSGLTKICECNKKGGYMKQCKWLAVDRKTAKRGAVLWAACELKEFAKLYPKKKIRFRAVWL